MRARRAQDGIKRSESGAGNWTPRTWSRYMKWIEPIHRVDRRWAARRNGTAGNFPEAIGERCSCRRELFAPTPSVSSAAARRASPTRSIMNRSGRHRDIEAIELARGKRYLSIISHRSGETEDNLSPTSPSETGAGDQPARVANGSGCQVHQRLHERQLTARPCIQAADLREEWRAREGPQSGGRG